MLPTHLWAFLLHPKYFMHFAVTKIKNYNQYTWVPWKTLFSKIKLKSWSFSRPSAICASLSNVKAVQKVAAQKWVFWLLLLDATNGTTRRIYQWYGAFCVTAGNRNFTATHSIFDHCFKIHFAVCNKAQHIITTTPLTFYQRAVNHKLNNILQHRRWFSSSSSQTIAVTVQNHSTIFRVAAQSPCFHSCTFRTAPHIRWGWLSKHL